MKQNFNLLLLIKEKLDLNDDFFFELELYKDFKHKFFNLNSIDINIIKGFFTKQNSSKIKILYDCS